LSHPVLLLPWPPNSAEPRRVEWSDYLQDPTIGLIADPTTSQPLPEVISVRIRVLDLPPGDALGGVRIGEIVELPLVDFLTLESDRLQLGRIPWAQRLEFKVLNQPPALKVEDEQDHLSPADFEAIKAFLFDTLAAGPLSELEIIGPAADAGIPPAALREVKERLRIASVRDEDATYPRTLWRLRMSQAFKIKRKGRPGSRR
jgi:hypothetical protein